MLLRWVSSRVHSSAPCGRGSDRDLAEGPTVAGPTWMAWRSPAGQFQDVVNTFEFYGALWRHKIFITAMTAVFVVSALALTLREQKIYQASSLVRVQQLISDPGQALGVLAASAQLAQTYGRIVETSTIAAKISTDSKGQLPLSEVAGHISGAPVQGLDMLTISARSPDPLIAEKVANAAPRALESFIRQTGTLRDQVTLVQRADLPTSPASPNVKLNLALALLLGLIFNAALALAIDLISDRIGDADEFEKLTGVPVLASIPTLKFMDVEVPINRALDKTEAYDQSLPQAVRSALNG
jgi:capsular polysaccharide biosynthesis protein